MKKKTGQLALKWYQVPLKLVVFKRSPFGDVNNKRVSFNAKYRIN